MRRNKVTQVLLSSKTKSAFRCQAPKTWPSRALASKSITMTEIDLRVNKTFCGFYRGQYHYPVERSAVIGVLKNNPGLTIQQLHIRLDIEKSIIKDVVAELYDSGKILMDISGSLFLSENNGGVSF